LARNRLIPFRFLPAAWGLSGPARLEAEAAYYYEGEDLEHRLVDIRNPHDDKARRLGHLAIDRHYGHIDTYEHDRELLEIEGRDDERAILKLDRAHGRIGDYDHDVALAKLDHPSEPDQTLALLEVERAYEKISEREYEKAIATAERKPWVGILRDNFDINQGLNGLFIEFDWNDFFIEYLRLHGYVGLTDDALVEAWFTDLCRSTAHEATQEEVSEWDQGPVFNPPAD
jgi:hypothetical protein